MQNVRNSLYRKQWTIFMTKQWTVLINAENRFYEKTVNNLCSEQRIIYAKKRVNNFLNNAEQKIILCKILEIVYAENSKQFFYEKTMNSFN